MDQQHPSEKPVELEAVVHNGIVDLTESRPVVLPHPQQSSRVAALQKSKTSLKSSKSLKNASKSLKTSPRLPLPPDQIAY